MFGKISEFTKLDDLDSQCRQFKYDVEWLTSQRDRLEVRITELERKQQVLFEYLELQEVHVKAFTQLVKVPKP